MNSQLREQERISSLIDNEAEPLSINTVPSQEVHLELRCTNIEETSN